MDKRLVFRCCLIIVTGAAFLVPSYSIGNIWIQEPHKSTYYTSSYVLHKAVVTPTYLLGAIDVKGPEWNYQWVRIAEVDSETGVTILEQNIDIQGNGSMDLRSLSTGNYESRFTAMRPPDPGPWFENNSKTWSVQ